MELVDNFLSLKEFPKSMDVCCSMASLMVDYTGRVNFSFELAFDNWFLECLLVTIMGMDFND